MEIERESWDVAGWDISIDYVTEQVYLYIGSSKFYLDYKKEETDCQIKEFIDFLYKALSKFQEQEKPVETACEEIK